MERVPGQREGSGEQSGGAAEGCARTSSPAAPSGEQRCGAGEGRAGTSSRAPPSGEKRSGAAEGRSGTSSSAPPSGEQRGGGESPSAAAGADKKGANLSSGSTDKQGTCKKEINQSSMGILPTEFKKRHTVGLQARRPSLIKALCQKRLRRVRDSVDISCRPRPRPRRRKIKWQEILREWPDEANNYADRDKVAGKSKNSVKKTKWIRERAAKLQSSCRGRTSSIRIKDPPGKLLSSSPRGTSPTKRVIVPVRTTADVNSQDPLSTRILLPNDMSGTELDSLFKEVVQRGFKWFVNNSGFQRALLRRICKIYDSEVSGRNSRKQ